MTRGFDIYIPALFPHHTPFRYEQQEEAYRHFSANVGFDPAVVTTLLHDLRTQYETLIVVGYSVGATLAWLSAASGLRRLLLRFPYTPVPSSCASLSDTGYCRAL